MEKIKTIIGSEEFVSFPELNLDLIHARIDTGATTSSLGVKSIVEVGDSIQCLLPNKKIVTFTDFKKKTGLTLFG